MCRCRRYIRFMRRVASTGQEESAPISRKYADIHTPHPGCEHSLHPMFARQGCDKPTGAAADGKNTGIDSVFTKMFASAGCRKTAASPRYARQIADSRHG